jgi:hypothetical protein
VIGRDRYQPLEDGDQLGGEPPGLTVVAAPLHHSVPHRAEVQFRAVASQACQYRLQRGVVIRKVTPLVDQRRAAGAGEAQTTPRNADPLDLAREKPRFFPARLVQDKLEAGRAGVDRENPLGDLIEHHR